MLSQLHQSWPTADWCDVTVVVAVSGGADSVSLLCGLAELREQAAERAVGKLVVAHFNHRLRDGAERDEKFVRDLAARMKLPCEVGYPQSSAAEESVVGVPALTGPDGVEAAARKARYSFLLEAAERVGARYVVTAHTADDQSETVLHRILRGTGLAGLAGIPRARPLSPAVTLIRPLLDVCRGQVAQYLADRHQTYCLDESNEDPSYTRNRIRHALLPQLAAQYNPNVREALVRLGKLAAEGQQVIEQRAEELLDRAVVSQLRDEIVIDCDRLQDQPPHLVREVLIVAWKRQQWPLQQMGFQEWDGLARMVAEAASGDAPAGQLPGGIEAETRQRRLRLCDSKSQSTT
jgi:tRNA(Ile)-lysidine synthase